MKTQSNPPIPARQTGPRSADPPSGPAVRGLYLHVPFCFHKCHYCDFYSLVNDPSEDADKQRAFIDRLVGELEHQHGRYALEIETLFVGGGTPTLLEIGQWGRLLDVLHRLGLIDPRAQGVEFTVEANPETVNEDLMRKLVDGGVNRVSIGAQSFDTGLLKTLERWHDPRNVERAVKTCRDAGIGNLNLDLIFAVPGQSKAQLVHDLDRALALKPEHLSCYSLIFEPNTPLTQKRKMGLIHSVDETLEREMYEYVIERLTGEGYGHYEVSNFARPGRRCAHNMLYWTNANFLAVGPSGASHIDGRRWKNEAHLGRYLAGEGQPPVVDEEQLDPARSAGEQLMLRLRLIEGAPLAWLDSLLHAKDQRRRRIDDLVEIGMLERNATHLRLTRQGLFVADAVIAELL